MIARKFKERLKSFRKEDKGFSLVELIVVIVILAILIGVTIGGVYGYVHKSRVNTDINNAATIQSVASTLAADKVLYDWALKEATNDFSIEWSDNTDVTAKSNNLDVDFDTDDVYVHIYTRLRSLLTEGFPATKSADHFTLVFDRDGDGVVSVTCKAYTSEDNTNVLTADD